MKKNLLLVLAIVLSFRLFSQTPVDVAESTLKVRGLSETVFYYGFAEGDKVIFNFTELHGKRLKAVEIIEFPSSPAFMDYKTNKIENKTIHISKTGIYKFRFYNAAICGRICKFKIQRIPASEATKNFNTGVYWKTVNDTTYTTIQEKQILKSDTLVYNLTDLVAKVHSSTNLSGNKTTFNFTLPEKTIAWSYYIGVDQTGQKAFEKATTQLAASAGPLISKIPGYGPLAALALGGASYLSRLQSGEDIDFYIVDTTNVNLFLKGKKFSYLKNGKVINDFSRMDSPLKGMHYVCLSNDNAVKGVSVTVKITAIVVNQKWVTQPIQKIHVTSRRVAYLKN